MLGLKSGTPNYKRGDTVKKFNPSLMALCTLGVLSTACVEKSSPQKLNKVSLDSATAEAVIGDDKVDFKVINKNALSQKSLASKILKPTSQKALDTLTKLPQGGKNPESIAKTAATQSETLLVGFPIGLVGEQNIFGGVLTDITDTNSEDLGALKLTDLTPIHVRTVVTGISEGTPMLALVGCASDCSESAEQGPLLAFPIVGVDQESQSLILDMSAIGQELDLMSMIDPQGEYTKLRAIKSATVNVEYSVSTLVFDIKTDMVPVDGSSTNVTSFNVRWYMKLTSGFNSAFSVRQPTNGVGFFTTERRETPVIQRFAAANDGSSVHYHIKGVPEKYKQLFADSVENWNKEFKEIIGRDLLTYEFVDVGTPAYDEVVAGDIRFNVIEWELKHKAPYVGFGPSIANQYTGEIFSGNVLVQGVMTEDMYKRWFAVSDQVRAYQAQGKIAQAQQMLKDFNAGIQQKQAALSKRTFKMKLGKNLVMNVNSQRPELLDQIPRVFELTPEGMSYQEYVNRYMQDTLEHEIGHNLGLRHNFKGTVGAVGGNVRGTASRSIMEYLPNLHVINSGIGDYDRMAIAFGYRGVKPSETNWFCTDEHQVRDGIDLRGINPECNQNDATNDPFGYFKERLDIAIAHLVNPGSSKAPLYEAKELKGQIDNVVLGLTSYALGAQNTGDQWIAFFDKEGRPADKSQVPAYVVDTMREALCNDTISQAIAMKSGEAKAKAENNIKTASAIIQVKAYQLGFNILGQVDCQQSLPLE